MAKNAENAQKKKSRDMIRRSNMYFECYFCPLTNDRPKFPSQTFINDISFIQQ